uniref:clp protease proteolytic subunit n=1 Tax=Solanum dimorphandrum TaxID=2802705 RepID=UPI001FCD78A2|nr:clp protease proteolytic subunit [Solanum dimorphandrum]UNZ89548.1 clp protease proteolytic subunit [Solanum dimorphandrum]
MPLGVPKVYFRNPERPRGAWIDVYNRLYRERVVFLGHGIGPGFANYVIAVITYLNMADSTKDMNFFINCPGGWVVPGFAIYDAMQYVKPEIQTICIGLAASMGSFILAGGERTKRLAFPHARVMMHQPGSSYFMAQVDECVLEAEELLKMRETLTRVYAERTGKPFWVISEDLERDVFMSATEAHAYGLIDTIAVQKK